MKVKRTDKSPHNFALSCVILSHLNPMNINCLAELRNTKTDNYYVYSNPTAIRHKMTWATIQNQNNSTLKLFQPAEIVPKWTPIRNKNQLRTSSHFHIHSGVPQGRTLGPLLYVPYTSDLPTSRQTTLGTFADETAIFETHEDPTIPSLNLQQQLHIIDKYLKKWTLSLTNPSHRT